MKVESSATTRSDNISPWTKYIPSLAGIEDPEKAVRELVAAASEMYAVFNVPDDGREDRSLEPYFRKPVRALRDALKPFTTDSEKDGEA